MSLGSAPRARPARGALSWRIGAATIGLVALAPVAGLVFFALRGSGDLWPHLLATVLPRSGLVTLQLLAGVGVVVTLLGIGAAWLTTMYRFPGRRLLEVALLLPLAVPSYVMAFAWLDVAHPIGPVQSLIRDLLGIRDPRGLMLPDIRSLGGAILLLGLVLYPYVYVPVRALFLMRSVSLLDASRMLGAGRARTFFAVALPMARPAIAIGLSLALLETLNDIGASEFLGIRTLTVSIYTVWVTRSSIEGASQIALVLLAIVLMLILLERLGRQRLHLAGRPQGAPSAEAQPLTGIAAWLAILACLVPVTLGFCVPAVYLAVASWQRVRLNGLPADLGTWAGNSLLVATLAAALTIAAGLFLVYAGRIARSRTTGAMIRIAGIGYALPGTVLAVGLLVPVASLDNLLADTVRALTGRSIGLLLLGSGAALVLAYCLRFLTIAIGSIEAGFARVSPNLDLAARTLGAAPRRILRDVHWPILRPAIAAATLLIFVDAMKELPATLLLRPFNFETLATHIYGEAARGTYEDGAVAALVIVAVGMLPVALLARAGTAALPTRRPRREAATEASLA